MDKLIRQHAAMAMGEKPMMKKGGKVKSIKAKKELQISIPADPDNDSDMNAAPVAAAAPTGGVPMGLKRGGRSKGKMPHLARGGALGGTKHHGCDSY